MITNNHEAAMLLALDALAFADRISTDWPEEKQLRHLREQIALARKHLESEPVDALAEHDALVIENLKFPTMLRRMWSGGEVQAWLKEEANLLRQKVQEAE